MSGVICPHEKCYEHVVIDSNTTTTCPRMTGITGLWGSISHALSGCMCWWGVATLNNWGYIHPNTRYNDPHTVCEDHCIWQMVLARCRTMSSQIWASVALHMHVMQQIASHNYTPLKCILVFHRSQRLAWYCDCLYWVDKLHTTVFSNHTHTLQQKPKAAMVLQLFTLGR